MVPSRYWVDNDEKKKLLDSYQTALRLEFKCCNGRNLSNFPSDFKCSLYFPIFV